MVTIRKLKCDKVNGIWGRYILIKIPRVVDRVISNVQRFWNKTKAFYFDVVVSNGKKLLNKIMALYSEV